MVAILRAIQRAMEFFHSWVADGFSWAHNEWFSKIIGASVKLAKQGTWLYALILALLGIVTGNSSAFGALTASVGQGMQNLGVDFRLIAPASDKTLIITNAWNFFEYLFPAKQLLAYLGFFIGAKGTAAAIRMGVAAWQLLPFKMS